MEAQFLDWYQVREGVVPGEVHCKTVLEAARVRRRSYQRGYRHAGHAGGLEGDPKLGDSTDFRQARCDPGDPCDCYAEGHAAGLAEASAMHHRDQG